MASVPSAAKSEGEDKTGGGVAWDPRKRAAVGGGWGSHGIDGDLLGNRISGLSVTGTRFYAHRSMERPKTTDVAGGRRRGGGSSNDRFPGIARQSATARGPAARRSSVSPKGSATGRIPSSRP